MDMELVPLDTAGWGNQRHVQLQTEDSAMDDSVEGPSATIKQKIEGRGRLRKWSGAAIIVYL